MANRTDNRTTPSHIEMMEKKLFVFEYEQQLTKYAEFGEHQPFVYNAEQRMKKISIANTAKGRRKNDTHTNTQQNLQ